MKTLIIGGGLSGLALADALESEGRDYMLVEARSRLGGRIWTDRFGAGAYDMGPAWFWPGQPRVAALINRLGLEIFDQFTEGDLVYEDERGQVRRGQGFAAMQESWRLKGSLMALTDRLAADLPEARKHLNAPVTRLTKSKEGITATLASGDLLTANQVVFALPPRLAAEIMFEPALPAPTIQAMRGIPTWMAGQAKAVAVYETPFWRNAGLSGNVISRRGPMVEVHDASPAQGGPYALFGFIGVPPQERGNEQVLRQHLQAQLERLFGPEAAAPVRLFLKDWAFDTYTATNADQRPLHAHPTYGLPSALTDLWNKTLHFGGTEVAPQFGGYVEGALEAAENVLKTLKS